MYKHNSTSRFVQKWWRIDLNRQLKSPRPVMLAGFKRPILQVRRENVYVHAYVYVCASMGMRVYMLLF